MFYGAGRWSIDALKAAGQKCDSVIYKGAGHGFMPSGERNNPNVREGDKKARDEAWAHSSRDGQGERGAAARVLTCN
jgi:dienelactone hydrolase